LDELLAQGARIITLKGVGGVGKTRFASHYARNSKRSFPGGRWRVDLTEARTPLDLVNAIGQALSVPLISSMSIQGILARISTSIVRRGPMLLLLDNFEQLVQHSGVLFGTWVDQIPDAVFLMTSRESLRVSGEHVIPLAPLAQAESMELFMLRASAAGTLWQPSWELTEDLSRIVEELDCLPLAIELAAARSVHLTPKMLLTRIEKRFDLLNRPARDAVSRQSSLWNLIAWSWWLLEPWEQRALCQLSVTRGGCTLAYAVHTLDLSPWPAAPPAVDVVASLMDKSLLVLKDMSGEHRYDMLLSVRQFAEAMLLGQDAEVRRGVSRRHAGFCARFGSATHTVQNVSRELANILVALEYAIQEQDAVLTASLATNVVMVLVRRGPAHSGIKLIDRVFDEVSLSQVARTRLLLFRARLNHQCGGTDVAKRDCEEAIDMAKELKNQPLLARALDLLALAQAGLGQLTQSLECHEKALAILRVQGNPLRIGMTLVNQSHVHLQQGQPSAAKACLKEAQGLLRSQKNERPMVAATINLGVAWSLEGDLPRAIQILEEALTQARAMGDPRNEGFALGTLGELYHEDGELDRAETCLEEAAGIAEETQPRAAGAFLGVLAVIRAEKGNPASARQLLRRARTLLKIPSELAMHACRRSEVEHLCGETASARRALDEAERLFQPLEHASTSTLTRTLVRCRETLEDNAFADQRTLRAGRDGSWFQVGANERVCLGRRVALRLIFQHLLDARASGSTGGISLTCVQAAGWPGDVLQESSGKARVYTAVSTLRTMGLGDILQRQPDGYRLDPHTRLRLPPSDET